MKYCTGKPNTTDPKTVSSFDFVIENNNKYLSFLPNHLLVYGKLLVNYTKKNAPSTAPVQTHYLNFNQHRLSMPNGISQFIKDVDVSFNYSFPLNSNTPNIGTFSVLNYVTQLSRNFSGKTKGHTTSSNDYISMYDLYDDSNLIRLSDTKINDITNDRLYMGDIFSYPFKGLDKLSLSQLNDTLKNPAQFLSPQYSESSLLPPNTHLAFKIHFHRNIPILQLLYPSEVATSELCKNEMSSLPTTVTEFTMKEKQDDGSETSVTYVIKDIDLVLSKVQVVYELLDLPSPLLDNVFTSYKLIQTALTSSSTQLIDVFIPDPSTNNLFLSFSTESEINCLDSTTQFINFCKRLPPNLKSIKILFDTFEESEGIIYDNIFIDNLHLSTVDKSLLLYYNYLVNRGFVSADVAQKQLFPYDTGSKITSSKDISETEDAKLFNVFPISLQSLKAFQKNKGVYGISGSTSKPIFRIQLNFVDSNADIPKFYMHILYQNTQKVSYSSDPFNPQVDIERYALFT